MWDAIVNYLAVNYPTILVILVLLAIAIFVTWKLSKLHNRFVASESVINGIPCATHREEIRDIKSNMPILKDIKESVRKIEEYLIKNDPASMDVFVRKCSPLAITLFGEKLLEISGGKKCIDDNLSFFIEAIEALKPVVALDVEQYALSVLNENLKESHFNEVKNFIYQAPDPYTITNSENETRSLPLKLESLLLVMSIYLRDKYFEKHNEIHTVGFIPK